MKTTLTAASAMALVFTSACATNGPLPTIQIPQSITNAFNDIVGALNSTLNQTLSDGRRNELVQKQAALGVQSKLEMSSENSTQYASATNHYETTVAQGAVLGAVIGGVGCKFLADANDTQTTLCAAAGGVLGGLAGNEVATKNKELIADREKVLAEIEQAEKNREVAREVLAATESNIAYLEGEVEELEKKREAGTISEQQYEADIIEARLMAIDLANGVSKVKNDIEQQQKAFKDLKTQAAGADDINVKATVPQISESIAADEALLSSETTNTANRVTEFEQQFGAV